MKLKQEPDDFQVEEITTVTPSEGPHALYRLEKRGWSTPDALAAVRRRWRIEPRRISYGGLKDRHAATVQYLTIFHGPRRNLHHHDIVVQYLGQIAAPYTSRDIQANRFRLTLRDLPPDATPVIEARLGMLEREGVPNYFDDQRFGSLAGAGSEFVARLLVRGQFEEALRLALTAPYEHDRAAQKEEKRLLVAHWGDWPRLRDVLPRGHARSLIDYLRVHPSDFRGAVARLRPELRGLYLSAYQSHLWNRMLAAWLSTHLRPEQLRPVMLRLGLVPFHHHLEADQQHELAALQMPLPSARLKLDDADPRGALVKAILAEEGLELRQMQIKGIREMFFSRGERPARCLPSHLSYAFAEDDRHRGRGKLMLGFELPRGSYATLLVKAVALEG
ncbi:MAG TPA: tRNA pseudouridine(13) synthase TruD [Gemmataceae bacterium]|nr:tRNA pseudouridine(13) synthase TruD [Gemmataceae bacterium]